jgi:glyoxalase family protein
MELGLAGLHHVSALSAKIARSHDFFVRVLGMRPIVKTVNQDAPSMYHLFYGDAAGSPGSEMTIFDMPKAAPERRGNNSISLITFRVASGDALEFWAARFRRMGVPHSSATERDGRMTVDFEDREGTRLSFVTDEGEGDSFPWSGSTVPEEYQMRGLGYPVITVPSLDPTDRFLREALDLSPARTYPLAETPRYSIHVYEMGAGGPGAEVHVVVRDDLPPARYGAGGVHHVALRMAEDDTSAAWAERLESLGFGNSGVVDRFYFRSVYVREPNGVLFELATDGPGFQVDGPLGADRLRLPPFLEPRRVEIEAALMPLTLDDSEA